MSIIDNTIAAQIPQFDAVTPLAKVAQLQAQQQELQQAQFKQKQTEVGAEMRGVAPFVNSPEFPAKWSEAADRLLQRGVIDPQVHERIRNSPSPLMLKSIISQTESPEMAQRKDEAAQAQKNANRSYGLQERTATRLEDKTPAGFEANPEGGYRPVAGGPADPSYLERRAAATSRDDTVAQVNKRTEVLRANNIDPNSPEGKTYALTGTFTDPNLPKVLSPGSSVVRPGSGEVVMKNGGDALLDEDTIKAMAEQARAGDTTVFQNVGRGAQGAENIVKLRKEIVRQNTEGGVSGSEQALRNAEMAGVKAGQRAIGTKGANIEMAATEFNQVIPIVQAASKAVSRTNYPDLNKIILAYNEKTGDPNVVKFGGGVNTLVNLYARAISPTGVATVSDKDHAREILNKAWASGQFDAATGMMQQEIKAALESPEKVRDEMRKRFLSGQGAAPVGYPAPGAAKHVVIDGYKITEH